MFLTNSDLENHQLYSSIFNDYYKKINNENEALVINFLEPWLDKLCASAQELLKYKDYLLEDLRKGYATESSEVLANNVFRLNHSRLEIFKNNLVFLRKLKAENLNK